MDAPSLKFASIGGPISVRRAAWAAGVLATALILALVCASIVIGWRRLAGHLNDPLMPVGLLATGVVAACAAGGARLLIRRDRSVRADRRAAAVVRWLPGIAAVVLAIGVSLPGSSTTGLGLMWLAIVAEEIMAWRLWDARRATQVSVPPSWREQEMQSIVPDDRGPARFNWLREDSSLGGNVVQKLIRAQAEGIERIQGWLKATFDAAERNATLHVAFCPPFEEAPTLTVVQTSGPKCRIKTGQLLSYGVRLELKRALTEVERAVVVIEFSAQARCRRAS